MTASRTRDELDGLEAPDFWSMKLSILASRAWSGADAVPESTADTWRPLRYFNLYRTTLAEQLNSGLWRAALGSEQWRKLPACEFAGNGKLEARPTGIICRSL